VKAAFLTGIEQVEIRRAPEPKLSRDDEVKLRVEMVGVCGSDMHYYRTGRIGDQVVEFPWTIGHECSAEVVEVGRSVKHLRVGRRVAVDPVQVCGKCDQCLAGREHTCRNQAFLGNPGQAAGTLAEYVVVQGRCCYPVPETMTAVQTTMTEPFSIGVYGCRLAGELSGKAVAILGCGPIGLSVLLAIKEASDCKVYMTDIRDNRAALARDLGADWIGNPETVDVVGEILRAEPLGVDFAYECAGEQETIDHCTGLLKPGGTLMLVGIPETDRLSFEMNAMRRNELIVRNVRRQNKCVASAIELAASGRIDLDAMVTHHFSMDETGAAFDTVAHYKDNVVKAVIHVADGA